MNINLQEKSLIELKSLAYDLLVEQQAITSALQAVNQQIGTRAKEELEKQKEVSTTKQD